MKKIMIALSAIIFCSGVFAQSAQKQTKPTVKTEKKAKAKKVSAKKAVAKKDKKAK